MPKVTYPRPCPTCGRNLAKAISLFIRSNVVQLRIVIIVHTALFRFHNQITNSVTYGSNIRRLRNVLLARIVIKHSQSKQKMKLHWESMCSEVKSCYNCVFCNASFTRRDSWQRHLRRVHRRICGEQDINLFLHYNI